MSVAKTIEITAESNQSFEDAVKRGIQEASKTVDGIQSAWVKDHVALVDGARVTGYRVRLKITFRVEG